MCLHATVINAAQPEQNLNCHLSQVLLLCQQFCYYANSFVTMPTVCIIYLFSMLHYTLEGRVGFVM